MINNIIVLPMVVVKSMLKGKLDYTPWTLISICSSTEEQILNQSTIGDLQKMNCRDQISLVFHDIHKQTNNLVLFNKEHAKTIIEFIDKIQLLDERLSLVVHCDAGISRSGAVALFTCDYIGFDYEKFKHTNKAILPNTHILRTLQDNVDNEKGCVNEKYYSTDFS